MTPPLPPASGNAHVTRKMCSSDKAAVSPPRSPGKKSIEMLRPLQAPVRVASDTLQAAIALPIAAKSGMVTAEMPRSGEGTARRTGDCCQLHERRGEERRGRDERAGASNCPAHGSTCSSGDNVPICESFSLDEWENHRRDDVGASVSVERGCGGRNPHLERRISPTASSAGRAPEKPGT